MNYVFISANYAAFLIAKNAAPLLPFLLHSKLPKVVYSDLPITALHPTRETDPNSLIERFNRTFRQDVLDSYMFENLTEIRKYADAWAWMYNNVRPHSSLGQLTPVEFLVKYGKQENFPTFQRDNNNKFDWNYLVLNIAS